ncbi:protein tolkin-like [Saccoglossus kowalevskii]
MISGSIDSGSGSGGTDYSGSYGTDSPPPVTASLCNDEYVIHPGVLIDITSPNYPLLYADNLQCTWGVSTSSGKPIIVEFKFLALETGYDFLVILDIVGAIQKQYTGGRIPAPFISAGSQIRLQMMTDDSIHFGGFRVTAREFEEPIATTRASPSSRITRVSDIERTLSTTINTASVGMTTPSNAGCERHYNLAVNDVIYITSPNFPDYYTNDLNCLWTFATVDGATLSVNLVYFETEDLYDYVDGGTGSPLNGSIYIDRYSGTYHNHPVMLPSSRGWISFTSDSAYREHGFNISVTALGTDEEAQVTTASNTPSPCNAVYTISFGGSVNVTSPNFPNNYPDGVKCEWQVSTLSGKRIMVVFHNLSLQLHQDYLYISDGDDIRIVKLYTGNEIPLSPFISNSSYIHMIFDASSTGNDTGFWVTAMETEESPSLPPTPFRPNTEVTDSTVSTGDLPVSTTTNSISCSGHYDVSVDRVHIISSPNYPNNYDNSLNCLWTFSAVDGALIRIVFITFGTEEGYDVLFVGEGDPNTGTTDYFLSGSVLPTDISSTTSSLWVKFQSDASVTAIGFKFAVVAVTGEGKK